MTMKSDSVSGLAHAAFGVAARAALEYFKSSKTKPVSEEALNECLKSHIRANMTAALHDAKEAIACNMTQAAVQTFAASMALAGIEAAKESGVQS